MCHTTSSCQPSQRLENLCRLCTDSHWPSSSSLRQRFLRSRIESNRLCSGLYHDRSVPFAFPMGPVPSPQGRCEIAHPVGSTGKYPFYCHYHSRQGSRRQHPRPVELQTRSLLHHRSWLSGFRSPLCYPSSIGLLRHPNQKQFQVQAPLLSAHRQIHRGPMRSNHCARRILFPQGLSRQTPTYSLFRYRSKQRARFLNQQLHSTGINNSRTVSVSLADRDLLQMDQAAPTYQSVLWHHRECRENPNLDCHHGIRVGSHHQKTTKDRSEPLHNSTDFECDTFRKNAHFRGSFHHSTPRIRRGTL